MPRLVSLLCLAATALGCTAAESRHAAAAITDDFGRPVVLAAAPHRIVSLVPSITELIVALGAGERLAGRTDFDSEPTLQHLPSVGRGLTPSVEGLAGLRPDLVILWASGGGGGEDALVTHLGELGIPVYGVKTESVGDFERHAAQLGTMLGERRRADSLVAAIDEGLLGVRQAMEGADTVTVLYVVWHDPPMTSGPGTFIDSMITIAGGRNIFGDAPSEWPQVSMEEIVRRDPDVLVLPSRQAGDSAGVAWVYRTPGWRDLRATRGGRLIIVQADLFNRPGPRVVEAAAELASFLHPDLIPTAIGVERE